MKAALVTPFVGHLPLYPSTFLGYGGAVLKKKYDLDIIDLNADIYFRSEDLVKKLHFDFSNNKKVIFDFLEFHPIYCELLKCVPKEYEQISWRSYQSVFITMPSWFVNISTENILSLSNLIYRKAPDCKVFFFGNSLGSWTDEHKLRNSKVNIIHLSNILNNDPVNEPINYDSLPTPIYVDRSKYMFDILPFRMKHGCLWGKCKFCSLAKGWNSGFLERSAKRIFQELEELDSKHNPKLFQCNDNAINGSNLLKFCMYSKNLKKPWIGMARADLTNNEIKALHKASCRLLYFGLESGSDRVLSKMNKGISTRQISDFIINLYKNNIIPAPSLFVGAHNENENDFQKTIQFVLDHKNYFDVINLYPFMITPASELSLMNMKSNDNTLIRLNKLIKICTGVGMKVCVGEQSAEYNLLKKVYVSKLNF